MPKLLVTNKSQGVREYQINDGTKLYVGRESKNDIVISDPRVSRVHASFNARGSKLFISDLMSRNGTMINGEPVVGDRELFNRDIVNIVDTVIEVQVELLKASYETADTTSTGGYTNTKIAAAQFRCSHSLTEEQIEQLRSTILSKNGRVIHSEDNWLLAWWHGNSINKMAQQTVSSSIEILNDLKESLPSLNVFVFALSALLEEEEPTWKISLMGDPIKICEEFNDLLSAFSTRIVVDQAIAKRVSPQWKFNLLASIRLKKDFPQCDLFTLSES